MIDGRTVSSSHLAAPAATTLDNEVIMSSYPSYYGNQSYQSYDESFGHSGSYQAQIPQGGCFAVQGGSAYGQDHHNQDYYQQQQQQQERGYSYYGNGGGHSEYDGNFEEQSYASSQNWPQDHHVQDHHGADMG